MSIWNENYESVCSYLDEIVRIVDPTFNRSISVENAKEVVNKVLQLKNDHDLMKKKLNDSSENNIMNDEIRSLGSSAISCRDF